METVTDSSGSIFLRDDRLATPAELQGLGVSRGRLRRLTRTGQVTAVAHGVYAPTRWLDAIGADPRRMHAVAVGAVIKRNPGLVGSHESAAFIHGIDILLPPGMAVPAVTLTRAPQSPGRSLLPGTRLRVATLPPSHVTTVDDIPLTSVARTVMDVARTTGFMEGVVAADSALHNHAAIKVEFAMVLQDCPQWRGVVRARQVVEFSDVRSESALESVARVRFAQYGIRPPTLQVNISGRHGFIGRADFCWHEYRTVAEADGAVKYEDNARARALAQLARDEKLHDERWATFHFTWREIYYEPGLTIDRLRRVFSRGVAGKLSR